MTNRGWVCIMIVYVHVYMCAVVDILSVWLNHRLLMPNQTTPHKDVHMDVANHTHMHW